MRTIFYILVIILCSELSVFAQLAKVQFIHNSPTLGSEGGPQFDIYLNGVVLPGLRGFNFRSATPFINLPTDVNIQMDIRSNPSTTMDPIIKSFDLGMLDENRNYIISLCGVLGGFPGIPDLNLCIFESALIESSEEDQVAIAAFHGSILLPKVSFSFRNGRELFLAEYGDYTNYQLVEEGLFFLDVEVLDIDDLIFTYRLDLHDLAGQSMIIIASGPAIGQPELAFFGVLPDGRIIPMPFSPVARAQWIHAIGADTVDVYADNLKIIDDLVFKQGSGFEFVPADKLLKVGLSPYFGASSNDVFIEEDMFFANRRDYVVVSSGFYDDDDYPFNLRSFVSARVEAENEAETDIAVIHNVPWLPPLDVRVQGTQEIIDSLAFGRFSPYLSITQNRVFIDFIDNQTEARVASFLGFLPEGSLGKTVHLVLGSIEKDSDDYFLIGVTSDGESFEFERIQYTQIQLIHNAPTPILDVYLNDFLVVNNMTYRSATSFIDIPEGILINIGFAPPNSTSARDTFYNFSGILEPGLKYYGIANGIIGNPSIPFQFTLINEALHSFESDIEKVAIAAFNGIQGAPMLDISSRSGNPQFNSMSYLDFQNHAILDLGLYLFDLELAEDDEFIATYEAELDTLGGNAGLLFASGVFGGDPEIGLFLILSDGQFIPLALRSFARVQVINASKNYPIDLYINEDLIYSNLDFSHASPFIDLNVDFDYTLAIAPAGSTDVNDAIIVSNLEIIGGRSYYTIFQGEESNLEFPLSANFISGRTSSFNLSRFDILVYNSNPSNQVFSASFANSSQITPSISYGEFIPYLNSDANRRLLKLLRQPQEELIGALDLPGNEWNNIALPLILHGNDMEQCFAVLPNGNTILLPLKSLAYVQSIQNLDSNQIDLLVNHRREIQRMDFREASAFLEVLGGENINLKIAISDSADVQNSILDTTLILSSDSYNVLFINGFTNDPDDIPRFHLLRNARPRANQLGSTDVLFHQATTKFNTIDVKVHNGPNVILGLPYGAFSEYQSYKSGARFFEITTDPESDVQGIYYIDLRPFEGLSGVIYTSTVADSSLKTDFLMATSNGHTAQLRKIEFSDVRLLHNAIGTGPVDIYYNGSLIYENYNYLDSVEKLLVAADIEATLTIYTHGSTDEDDFLAELSILPDLGKSYLGIFQGVKNNANFPLQSFWFGNYRVGHDNPNQAIFSFYHGAPGTEEKNGRLRYIREIFEDLSYGNIFDYQASATGRYILDLYSRPSEIDFTFNFDLNDFGGKSLLAFISGVLGSDDAPFKTYLLDTDGLIRSLEEIQVGRIQVVNASTSESLDLYVGEDKLINGLARGSGTSYLETGAGEILQIGVAPGNSNNSNEIFESLDLKLDNGQDFQLFITGQLGNTSKPITVVVFDDIRFIGKDPLKTEINVLNASVEADSIRMIMVDENQDFVVLADWLKYNHFSGFSESSLLSNEIQLSHKDGNYRYQVPIQNFEGQVITLFTLDSEDEIPDIYGLRANGLTFILDRIQTSTHESFSENPRWTLYPNPTSMDHIVLKMPEKWQSELCICSITTLLGQMIHHSRLDFSINASNTFLLDISRLANGMYSIQLNCAGQTYSQLFNVQR